MMIMMNTDTKTKMLHRADTLSDFNLRGIDGDIGTIKEFYFDDSHWTIRYIVAETGNWLFGREVLISPHSLGAVNNEEEYIAVNLTEKQMEESPTFQTGQTVSREFEDEYNTYYGLPTYWNGTNMSDMARDTNRTEGGNGGWANSPNIAGDMNRIQGGNGGGAIGSSITGDTNKVQGVNVGAAISPNITGDTNRTEGGNAGGAMASNMAGDTNMRRESVSGEQIRNHQLHSTADVSGYDIEASDGEIGDVKDFIIDDETWAIRYLIVDTGGWLPGKKVLIAPQWIERVSWEESKVFINLSRDAIEKSPEFTEELTRDYEAGLYKHYNRQGYWID